MLSLSGIKYIPSGQCPGYLNEAYSWDIVVYVTNAGPSVPASPITVQVVVAVVLGVGGCRALPGWVRPGVCEVDVEGRDDRGGVDGVPP